MKVSREPGTGPTGTKPSEKPAGKPPDPDPAPTPDPAPEKKPDESPPAAHAAPPPETTGAAVDEGKPKPKRYGRVGFFRFELKGPKVPKG